jgi:hypothetical protein
MSRIVTVIITYRHHKPVDFIYNFLGTLLSSSHCEKKALKNVDMSIKLVYVVSISKYSHKTHRFQGNKNIKYASSKALSKRHTVMQLISSCKMLVRLYEPIQPKIASF